MKELVKYGIRNTNTSQIKREIEIGKEEVHKTCMVTLE